MIEPPQIVNSPAQHIACIRLKIPPAEIRQVMMPGLQEIMAALAAQGMKPAGPWLTHHFQKPVEMFDFEIAVPVATPIAPSGRVQPGQLRATKVARTVYHGGYEGLVAAWGEFCDWISAEGLQTAPDLWECYAKGPESGEDSSNWETQLNQPLA
ncbi:MAG TPA: GyrI-like domain-containing protein [Pirellulaceae bacterium]|nr:GyrI-like domain-containing protein [Pirellulaceae bacterium]